MEAGRREVGQALIDECKYRLLDESVPRLEKCLSLLGPDEIWFRPNPETVSVGNLVLHLCGNVTQWILSGLGGKRDERVRDLEFEEKGPLPVETLHRRLRDTMAETRAVLDRLDPATLLEPRRVQGFDQSAVGILVHVVEHFSYHVGQVSYTVKSRKSIDLGYYAGADLNRTD